MDSTDDSSSTECKVTKGLNDRGCSERIEAGSRLIKEYQLWISNELDTDRCAFSLSSGHSLDKGAADLSILALVKSELLNNFVNSVDLLLVRPLELELGSELEAFTHCHSLEENIVLLHVGRESREIASHLFLRDSVYQDLPVFVKPLTDLPPWEVV